MARSSGRRRTSSDESSRGTSGRVIMVGAKQKTATAAAKGSNAPGKNSTSRAKGAHSIVGRMWDSFESESDSEDSRESIHQERHSLSEHTRSGESTEKATEKRGPPKAGGDRVRAGPHHEYQNSPPPSSKGEHSGGDTSSEDDQMGSDRPRARRRGDVRGTPGNGAGVKLAPRLLKKASAASSRSGNDDNQLLADGDSVDRGGNSEGTSLSPRQQRRRPSHRRRLSRGAIRDSHESDDEESASDERASEGGSYTPPERRSRTSTARASKPVASDGPRDERTVQHKTAISLATRSEVGATGDPEVEPTKEVGKVDSQPLDASIPTVDVPTPTASEANPAESTRDRMPSSERGAAQALGKTWHARGLLRKVFWMRAADSHMPAKPTVKAANTRPPNPSEPANDVRRAYDDTPSDDRQAESGETAARDEPDAGCPARSGRPDTVEGALATSKSDGNGDAPSGRTRRSSRRLSRARSQTRRQSESDRCPESPGSRSPSLARKLGMSLRGAIMGKQMLGVHEPHLEPRNLHGSDGDTSSEATYSGSEDSPTGDRKRSSWRKSKREPRRGCDQRGKSSRTGKRSDGGQRAEFNDGFDSGDSMLDGVLDPEGPDDPRNLPEVVHSYIGARQRLGQELSATGPAFLPQASKLAQMSGVPASPWSRPRASLDVTKEAPSTTQMSEQHQPFTEAMFKAGVSETRHSTKQGILLEGELQKFSPESLRGVRWHKRYFVLYAGACELRYYRTYAEAAWGKIPLGERGSIPLRLVVKIEQPSDKKYRGSRFDLVVLHKGEGRHPGLHIRPGREKTVITTKTFRLDAADAQQRLLWVSVIEALMKKRAWGEDAERRSITTQAYEPRVTGDVPCDSAAWESWGGAGETPDGSTPSGAPVHPGSWEFSPGVTRDESLQLGGVDSWSRAKSVLNFVETAPDDAHKYRQSDEARGVSRAIERGDAAAPWSQRGMSIPYSPAGRRGSLTTGALSPPLATQGSPARRQNSRVSEFWR